MIQIINSFHTIDWGGGKSTELFIFPENANYAKREFDFRLSTATVEIEESLFSPLEGVDRKLMILEGEMHLYHENHHEKLLKKYDVDEFHGGWKTRSEGKCVDFNLMLKNGTKGSVKGLSLEKGASQNGHFFGSHFFIWIYSGEIELEHENQSKILKKMELIHLCESTNKNISFKAKQSSEIVIVEIL